MQQSDKLMTDKECRMRQRPLIWSIGVLFVICGLFATIAGFSLSASATASNRAIDATSAANDATMALAIYRVGQDRDIKHISSMIEELKTEIRELKSMVANLDRRVGD